MISNEQLEAVGDWLADNKSDANLEQGMRAAFPDIHFTFCLDDDVISDQPASVGSGYKLYLVDSSSHCLSLTTDSTVASGLVVAELGEE